MPYLDLLKDYLAKQGPPRPGLVPKSGDPEHPVRWIRPTGVQGASPKRTPKIENFPGMDYKVYTLKLIKE